MGRRTFRRDPFAMMVRYSDGTIDECDECGESARLFSYGTVTDDGDEAMSPGRFCTFGCWEAHSV